MKLYEALRTRLLKWAKSDFCIVLIFGAFGGLLFWTWATLQEGQGVATWTLLAKSVMLGAGSAVILVFLIFNTDREDRPRFYATSVMGGLLFGVVIHGLIIGSSKALLEPTKIFFRETVEHPMKGRDIGRLIRLLNEVIGGLKDPHTVENLEVIEIAGGWVEISDDNNDGRIDRLVRISERTEVKIEVEPKDGPQDLTAWLLKIDDGAVALFGSSDDATLGNLNPTIQTTLVPGRYVLRILPFNKEHLGPIRVRIRIVLR